MDHRARTPGRNKDRTGVTMIRLTVLCGALILAVLPLTPALSQDIPPAEELPAYKAPDAVVESNDDINPAVDTSASKSDAERGTLTTTTITGNAELPRVLYILPWKKASPGDLMGKPVNSLLDDVLQPLDRGEFRRQLRYFDGLNQSEASEK